MSLWKCGIIMISLVLTATTGNNYLHLLFRHGLVPWVNYYDYIILNVFIYLLLMFLLLLSFFYFLIYIFLHLEELDNVPERSQTELKELETKKTDLEVWYNFEKLCLTTLLKISNNYLLHWWCKFVLMRLVV